MAVGQVIAEVGDVAVSIEFFINHIGVGNDGQKREGAVGDVEPVDPTTVRCGVKNRLFGNENECLGVEVGDGRGWLTARKESGGDGGRSGEEDLIK